MKTVELTTGDKAIPVNIKHYVTKETMVSIVTDVVFHKNLNENELRKSEVISLLRTHLFYQGKTTYCDWYEDTVETPVINGLRRKVEKIITEMFPELIKH